MNAPHPSLALNADAPEHRRLEARRLAESLGRRLLPRIPDDPGLVLLFTAERVELRHTGARSGPVYCDFIHGSNAHRQRYGGGRGQALARACGIKPGKTPSVIDATAGLGRDAWVLATLGCELHAIENHPFVHALLKDGLLRALDDPNGHEIASRIRLHHSNSLALLPKLEAADTVFLDPMFPGREKSASVKKEMSMLQHITETTTDESTLLNAARRHCLQRVAVKRPVKSKPLANIPPHASIPGRTIRFDLYLGTD